jgi:hydroxymethylbilane synthase
LPEKNILRLATRQSKLALWQANFVKNQLETLAPHCEVVLVPLLTEGDKITDRPLADLGGKGLFIKRLEQALLNDEADFAVHSMKDVPPKLDNIFSIPAILQRASPCDVFVSTNYQSLKDLPSWARVGTCSVRRTAQIRHFRHDLHTLPVRGNVDTRLNKLTAGEYDALILAEAGLERLGLANHIKEVFPTSLFLPSVGQGALGVECLCDNMVIHALLKLLNHQESELCVRAERALNAHLGAHCDSPVGSFAEIMGEQLLLRGEVLSHDGSKKIVAAIEGPMKKAESLGRQVAIALITQGAQALF